MSKPTGENNPATSEGWRNAGTPGSSPAEVVRALLEQLDHGWQVTSAVVRVDGRGNLHVSDVRVEENVGLGRGGHGRGDAEDARDMATALNVAGFPPRPYPSVPAADDQAHNDHGDATSPSRRAGPSR